MATLFIHHPIYLLHDANEGHPESPERLLAIEEALKHHPLPGLERRLAIPAAINDLLRAHTREYIDHVFASMPKGRALNFLDHDTGICAESGTAALHAAGAVIQASDAVIKGEAANAFCVVRPPGHHAHRNHAAGFCIFNNIAIGAMSVIDKHSLKRVAILDFDVHHGDGTQDIIWDNPDILLASTYQYPLYTASPLNEQQVGAYNNIINKSFPPGTPGRDIVNHWKLHILPEVEKFKPEMIFISAGFDGHKDDPLANLCFTTEDYGDLMRAIKKMADKLCNGHIVAVLEGGYDLRALSQSVISCLKVLST